MKRILIIMGLMIVSIILLIGAFLIGYLAGYDDHMNPLEGYDLTKDEGKKSFADILNFCSSQCSQSTVSKAQDCIDLCLYFRSPVRR